MACLILKSEWGERRIPAGPDGQFRRTALPGETVVGIDPTCDGGEVRNVDDELASHGVQWGDAIAWATKKLGIRQCAPCKARRLILNNVSKNGWADTIKQIKGTF